MGLTAYLFFYVSLFRRYWRAVRRFSNAMYFKGFVYLAMVFVFVFLVDQMKVSYLRFLQSDSQQFILALFGALLGLSESAATGFASESEGSGLVEEDVA